MSPGTYPWVIGETLTGTIPYMPSHVVIVFNQTGGGGATILASQDLTSSVSVPQPQNQGNWFLNPVTGQCNWAYRKKITIDHTKVSATQTSFPVLISLSADPDLSAHALITGNDILFTDSSGTNKIPYEIENYTSGTGSLTAWVNVASLSSTTDTVLYLYYGNSTSSSQQNPTAVWDSSFQAVWHLKEAGTGGANDYNDSTTHANNGQGGGGQSGLPNKTTGQISYGQLFDGSSDYISTTNTFTSPLTAFTESIWFKTMSAASGKLIGLESNQKGTGWASQDWTLYLGTGGYVVGGIYNASSGVVKNVNTSPTTYNGGNWHYAVLTWGSTNLSLYVDGSYIGSNTGFLPQSMTGYLRMGSYRFSGLWPYSAAGYYSGSLDEARFSSAVRSSSWIYTEYQNQMYPSSFYSVGSEEKFWKC